MTLTGPDSVPTDALSAQVVRNAAVPDGAVRNDSGRKAVAWLDVGRTPGGMSASRIHTPALGADPPSVGSVGGRPPAGRTGPLGLHILPLRLVGFGSGQSGAAPYFFSGARLRGVHCAWSASTVCGARLKRQVRAAPVPPHRHVHILVRMPAVGSVFDPVEAAGGTLRVLASTDDVDERFGDNTHLFTLAVPAAALGLEPAVLREMSTRLYHLTPLQSQLLRGAVGLLIDGDEVRTPAGLAAVDRYLAALAALLLRTAVSPDTDMVQLTQLRERTDAMIAAQATDPDLTPTVLATQLGVSLRQLYRVFNGAESPAARIRRRRLQRAAEILTTRAAPEKVERIALECGFVSAEYFSRAFRREFGVSPRAYRSAHRDTLAPAVDPMAPAPRKFPARDVSAMARPVSG